MVQPVKAATVDTVACLPRAHVTRFDTGEMILVPVLDSKTNALRVPDAILSAQRGSLITKIDARWIKESHLKSVQIQSLWLDGHGALGVESVE